MCASDSGIPILVIEKLRKDFRGVEALRGIDLILEKPGVYGFLGPNGAGKTTTFKLVSALLRPSGGRILIGGIDVQENPRLAVTKLGVLFDAPAYYAYMTGRENLEVFSRWLGRDDRGRIDDLLSLVGLSTAGNRRVREYSWGMKRRLGLASALLSDPELILLDEPTEGLDPGGIADVRRLLPELAHEQRRTVFLSSHRMAEVERICDHVTIIHEGAIVASGTPAGLAGGDAWIEVHCPDPGAAGEILRGIEGIVRIEQADSTRLLVFAPPLSTLQINRILTDGGVSAGRIMERRESLEDVFFRLTGTRGDDIQEGS